MINEILYDVQQQQQLHQNLNASSIDQSPNKSLQLQQTGGSSRSSSAGSVGASSLAPVKQELLWDSSNVSGGSGKKYRCDICGIALSAFGSIKRHKDAVHFGIRKKFVERECPICHKSYFQLQKHIKIKHRESKVKCSICDRILSCSFSYKRHLKKVHGFKYKYNSGDEEAVPTGIKVSGGLIEPKKEMNYPASGGFPGPIKTEGGVGLPYPSHHIPPPFDPMMTPRMEPPAPPPPPDGFQHLMPGMYPPPFTPFKRDFPPTPPNNMMQQYAPPGPPYEPPSPYQYPPFYMNDPQRNSAAAATSLIKNGTKELANILGIDSSYASSSPQGGTQPMPASSATNTCTICGNSFKDASSLRRHTRIKHASKFQAMEDSKAELKKYRCHICSVSLSCSGSIQRHIRLMHNKVAGQVAEKSHPDFPYPCPVCHRSFANEISLQRHASYHKKTGEIPPDTNISTYTTCTPCDRGFENNWSYERHLMQHPNPQAALPSPPGKVCNVCNLVVTTSMSLRRHKKLKHPDLYMQEESMKSQLEMKKRYKCLMCEKPIASYSSLQRHMKLVHNKGHKPDELASVAHELPIKTEDQDLQDFDQPMSLLTRTPFAH